MILIGTHTKLVKQGATIYRVDTPETIVMGVTIPGGHEHFATSSGAKKAESNWLNIGIQATITPVQAANFNPWSDR